MVGLITGTDSEWLGTFSPRLQGLRLPKFWNGFENMLKND